MYVNIGRPLKLQNNAIEFAMIICLDLFRHFDLSMVIYQNLHRNNMLSKLLLYFPLTIYTCIVDTYCTL